MEAVGKRRKVSKKTKRSWRKHTKVQDVEEFLEDRRREEVFGVPASEKPAEDLYYKDVSTTSTQAKPLSRKDIRHKPLRSEVNLQSNSAIRGFPSQKRKVARQPASHTGLGEVAGDSSEEEEFETSTSYRDIRRECGERLADQARKHPKKCTVHVGARDLWGDEEEPEMEDNHYLQVIRKKKVKKPNTLLEVPSLLKSVELPHPGMSYNPTFEDHQALLRTALSVEERKERAAQKLERRLQLAKMTHVERDQVWLEEMSEGILPTGEGEGAGEREREEEEVEEEECSVTKRPVRAEERKTKKQRRKEQLRRKEELMKRLAKAHRIKMDEVYRLRSIKKEIAQKEAVVSKSKARSLALRLKSPYLTKRLGRHLYKEPTIPFQLSSEVTGSLRLLKPEGSIAEDRFKSLQKRNIIEPRELVRPHRKYKLLVKEKRSAKIPEDKN